MQRRLISFPFGRKTFFLLPSLSLSLSLSSLCRRFVCCSIIGRDGNYRFHVRIRPSGEWMVLLLPEVRLLLVCTANCVQEHEPTHRICVGKKYKSTFGKSGTYVDRGTPILPISVFPTVAIRMYRSSPLVPLDSCLTAAACLFSAC